MNATCFPSGDTVADDAPEATLSFLIDASSSLMILIATFDGFCDPCLV